MYKTSISSNTRNTESQASFIFVLKITVRFWQILVEVPEDFPIPIVQSEISTSTLRGDISLTSEYTMLPSNPLSCKVQARWIVSATSFLGIEK